MLPQSSYQNTLRRPCQIQGIGIHSGREATITLFPAPPNTGIIFRVRENGRQVEIPARAEFIAPSSLNTTLGRDGLEVCTVEHLLAALSGLEIDNVVIATDGCEIPGMDGSAQPFVTRILEAGRKLQPVPRRYLKIKQPVVVEDGGRIAGLFPADDRLFSFLIDFDHPAIQTQSLSLRLTPQSFVAEIARARTFGFQDDLDALQEKGLALGAGLENAVGLTRSGEVLNAEGLRYPDEFVRHKILDAVGDLSLAGAPFLGEFKGIKSGHAMHARLMRALQEHPEVWEPVTLTPGQSAQAV
jgi:UDP-3-O-[3-hydroxymyristoyl] N-acetylglucosamine deacetylase